ncbi:MAG: hypothetical protein COV52_09580 [Gammaproteobacteria bacterium CG11_big_fil_rev_8_21_14_0_20_46_22]|nr:MAG: hypothetical protein COW05_04150 [Gammaproteobacteria bacterium CG12_big_fil_rev_8_21_14_0_65_46_12]PIR10264.1 MAG: hypothetical protein COV52_09580 [Gammaproteobacteria bacterium CG11_big_fil_rev_8_21_14_0_20_46_22]
MAGENETGAQPEASYSIHKDIVRATVDSATIEYGFKNSFHRCVQVLLLYLGYEKTFVDHLIALIKSNSLEAFVELNKAIREKFLAYFSGNKLAREELEDCLEFFQLISGLYAIYNDREIDGIPSVQFSLDSNNEITGMIQCDIRACAFSSELLDNGVILPEFKDRCDADVFDRWRLDHLLRLPIDMRIFDALFDTLGDVSLLKHTTAQKIADYAEGAVKAESNDEFIDTINRTARRDILPIYPSRKKGFNRFVYLLAEIRSMYAQVAVVYVPMYYPERTKVALPINPNSKPETEQAEITSFEYFSDCFDRTVFGPDEELPKKWMADKEKKYNFRGKVLSRECDNPRKFQDIVDYTVVPKLGSMMWESWRRARNNLVDVLARMWAFNHREAICYTLPRPENKRSASPSQPDVPMSEMTSFLGTGTITIEAPEGSESVPFSRAQRLELIGNVLRMSTPGTNYRLQSNCLEHVKWLAAYLFYMEDYRQPDIIKSLDLLVNQSKSIAFSEREDVGRRYENLAKSSQGFLLRTFRDGAWIHHTGDKHKQACLDVIRKEVNHCIKKELPLMSFFAKRDCDTVNNLLDSHLPPSTDWLEAQRRN